MMTACDAISRTLNGLGEATSRERLRGASGEAMMWAERAEDRFRRRLRSLGVNDLQVSKAVETAYHRALQASRLCESPIERMLTGPLVMADYDGFLTAPAAVMNPKTDAAKPRGDVVIIPQFPFIRYRADFAIIGELNGMMKIVIVECDGDDFHKDKSADRARDALFNSFGISVVRASGKEIMDNAVSVAERAAGCLIEWRSMLQEGGGK